MQSGDENAAVGKDGGNASVKCIIVGDGAVGKTSLIVSYTRNGFPAEYVPTAYDTYAVLVTINNEPIRLQLCDTAGQDDFDLLRPLCYIGADVILLCFSITSPSSFDNVSEKWLPEIRRHCPTAPIILVGTQLDLRNDVKVLIELAGYNERPVSEAEGQTKRRQIEAVSYFECSALTQQNLKDVFDCALLAGLAQQAKEISHLAGLPTVVNGNKSIRKSLISQMGGMNIRRRSSWWKTGSKPQKTMDGPNLITTVEQNQSVYKAGVGGGIEVKGMAAGRTTTDRYENGGSSVPPPLQELLKHATLDGAKRMEATYNDQYDTDEVSDRQRYQQQVFSQSNGARHQHTWHSSAPPPLAPPRRKTPTVATLPRTGKFNNNNSSSSASSCILSADSNDSTLPVVKNISSADTNKSSFENDRLKVGRERPKSDCRYSAVQSRGRGRSGWCMDTLFCCFVR